MKGSVYLAGPIGGLTYEGACEWRRAAQDVLAKEGIGVLSPMRFKGFLVNEGVLKSEEGFHNHALASSRGIFRRDTSDVRKSDVLLVNFLPNEERQEKSLGTAMEIMLAYELGKDVVLVSREDDINRVHPFVAECFTYEARTLEEGLGLVKAILCAEER